MKKKVFVLGILLIAIIGTTWYSCELDPTETCEQDEICTDKFVTACCTDNACVYKYNGKEYTDDQINQLAKDLGCGAIIVQEGSETLKSDEATVVEQLQALMARVREHTNSSR